VSRNKLSLLSIAVVTLGADRRTDRFGTSSSHYSHDGLQRPGLLHGDRRRAERKPRQTTTSRFYWGSTVVGSGVFNSSDNWTFSGSFTVDSSVEFGHAGPKALGQWGDGNGRK